MEWNSPVSEEMLGANGKRERKYFPTALPSWEFWQKSGTETDLQDPSPLMAINRTLSYSQASYQAKLKN